MKKHRFCRAALPMVLAVTIPLHDIRQETVYPGALVANVEAVICPGSSGLKLNLEHPIEMDLGGMLAVDGPGLSGVQMPGAAVRDPDPTIYIGGED